MDIQKDTQKTDGITKFVDNQHLKTNPFGENRVGERAYRRAERLSAAVILLTNHVPESEPLRRATREGTITLLAEIMNTKDEMRASNSEHGRGLRAAIRSLISLVRLLAISGFVSFQNSDTVTEALDELSSFLIASRRSTMSETVTISRDELIDIREATRYPEPRGMEKNLRDRDFVKDADAASAGLTSDSGVVSRNSGSESTRSQAILEVLRSGGELGIRDIAANLPEYSEKMIQRELASLVDRKRVKKMGLKRWSRYLIVG